MGEADLEDIKSAGKIDVKKLAVEPARHFQLDSGNSNQETGVTIGATKKNTDNVTAGRASTSAGLKERPHLRLVK